LALECTSSLEDPEENQDLMGKFAQSLASQWADAVVPDCFLTMLDNAGTNPGQLKDFLSEFLTKVMEHEDAEPAEPIPSWLVTSFNDVVKTFRGIAALLIPTPGVFASKEEDVDFVTCNTGPDLVNIEGCGLRVRSSIFRRLKQQPHWVAMCKDFRDTLGPCAAHSQTVEEITDTAAELLKDMKEALRDGESMPDNLQDKKGKVLKETLDKLPVIMQDLRHSSGDECIVTRCSEGDPEEQFSFEISGTFLQNCDSVLPEPAH
jgi:hypothetical protein